MMCQCHVCHNYRSTIAFPQHQALLIFLLVSSSVLHVLAFQCVFDQVKPETSRVTKCSLPYDVQSEGEEVSGDRVRRSTRNLFQPIRIEAEFYNLDVELSSIEEARLRNVIHSTVDKASKLLKVVPVKGPLVLARDILEACRIHRTGPNIGKCSSVKDGYSGEYCLDGFKVPDRHLEGLSLWNETYDQPIREVYGPGSGLEKTDFVLYVRSLTSPVCVQQGSSSVAYAAYCQLDQNDRPVAGYINFCPDFFSDPSYSEEKAVATALHELFHALGFASDLFPKFKDCTQNDDDMVCTDKSLTVAYVEGGNRLITPSVVNLTSAHFGCQTHRSSNEFGPILQELNGAVQSHWDAAFMQGSIMTPSIGLPHLMVLDPMTLAVFEDSGWYKVNYDLADTFQWGKGSGCQFGQNPYCEDPSSYFCSGSSQGCHILRLDKGTCDTGPFLHECRLYRAGTRDGCTDPNNSRRSDDEVISGEVFHSDSRCFFSNTSMTEIEEPVGPSVGRCYKHQCNDFNQLFVKVGESDYTYCPAGDSIQVAGYSGYVQCPPAGLVCNTQPRTWTTPPTTPVPSTARHPVDTDKSGVLLVDIYYHGVNYDIVSMNDVVFQTCNLEEILVWTGVGRKRLEDFYILSDSVTFRFNLLPVTFSNDGPPSSSVIKILEDTIYLKNFSFYLPPRGPVYVASSISLSDGGPLVSDEQLSGAVIAGAVIGALLGAVLIGVLVYFVQRYYSSHSRVIPNHGQESRSQQSSRSRSHDHSSRTQATTNQPRFELDYRYNPRFVVAPPTESIYPSTSPTSATELPAHRQVFTSHAVSRTSLEGDTYSIDTNSVASTSTSPSRARTPLSTRDLELSTEHRSSLTDVGAM